MPKPKAEVGVDVDETATLLEQVGELIIDGQLVKAPSKDAALPPVKTAEKEDTDNG